MNCGVVNMKQKTPNKKQGGGDMKTAIWPRGLNREKAAAYLGISSTLFDQMVEQKTMPQPFSPSAGRVVWDINELDHAFENLPRRNSSTREAVNKNEAWD